MLTHISVDATYLKALPTNYSLTSTMPGIKQVERIIVSISDPEGFGKSDDDIPPTTAEPTAGDFKILYGKYSTMAFSRDVSVEVLAAALNVAVDRHHDEPAQSHTVTATDSRTMMRRIFTITHDTVGPKPSLKCTVVPEREDVSCTTTVEVLGKSASSVTNPSFRDFYKSVEVARAFNFSDCEGKRNGMSCTVRCSDDAFTIKEGTPIMLACDANGLMRMVDRRTRQVPRQESVPWSQKRDDKNRLAFGRTGDTRVLLSELDEHEYFGTICSISGKVKAIPYDRLQNSSQVIPTWEAGGDTGCTTDADCPCTSVCVPWDADTGEEDGHQCWAHWSTTSPLNPPLNPLVGNWCYMPGSSALNDAMKRSKIKGNCPSSMPGDGSFSSSAAARMAETNCERLDWKKSDLCSSGIHGGFVQGIGKHVESVRGPARRAPRRRDGAAAAHAADEKAATLIPPPASIVRNGITVSNPYGHTASECKDAVNAIALSGVVPVYGWTISKALVAGHPTVQGECWYMNSSILYYNLQGSETGALTCEMDTNIQPEMCTTGTHKSFKRGMPGGVFMQDTVVAGIQIYNNLTKTYYQPSFNNVTIEQCRDVAARGATVFLKDLYSGDFNTPFGGVNGASRVYAWSMGYDALRTGNGLCYLHYSDLGTPTPFTTKTATDLLAAGYVECSIAGTNGQVSVYVDNVSAKCVKDELRVDKSVQYVAVDGRRINGKPGEDASWFEEPGVYTHYIAHVDEGMKKDHFYCELDENMDANVNLCHSGVSKQMIAGIPAFHREADGRNNKIVEESIHHFCSSHTDVGSEEFDDQTFFFNVCRGWKSLAVDNLNVWIDPKNIPTLNMLNMFMYNEILNYNCDSLPSSFKNDIERRASILAEFDIQTSSLPLGSDPKAAKSHLQSIIKKRISKVADTRAVDGSAHCGTADYYTDLHTVMVQQPSGEVMAADKCKAAVVEAMAAGRDIYGWSVSDANCIYYTAPFAEITQTPPLFGRERLSQEMREMVTCELDNNIGAYWCDASSKRMKPGHPAPGVSHENLFKIDGITYFTLDECAQLVRTAVKDGGVHGSQTSTGDPSVGPLIGWSMNLPTLGYRSTREVWQAAATIAGSSSIDPQEAKGECFFYYGAPFTDEDVVESSSPVMQWHCELDYNAVKHSVETDTLCKTGLSRAWLPGVPANFEAQATILSPQHISPRDCKEAVENVVASGVEVFAWTADIHSGNCAYFTSPLAYIGAPHPYLFKVDITRMDDQNDENNDGDGFFDADPDGNYGKLFHTSLTMPLSLVTCEMDANVGASWCNTGRKHRFYVGYPFGRHVKKLNHVKTMNGTSFCHHLEAGQRCLDHNIVQECVAEVAKMEQAGEQKVYGWAVKNDAFDPAVRPSAQSQDCYIFTEAPYHMAYSTDCTYDHCEDFGNDSYIVEDDDFHFCETDLNVPDLNYRGLCTTGRTKQFEFGKPNIYSITQHQILNITTKTGNRQGKQSSCLVREGMKWDDGSVPPCETLETQALCTEKAPTFNGDFCYWNTPPLLRGDENDPVELCKQAVDTLIIEGKVVVYGWAVKQRDMLLDLSADAITTPECWYFVESFATSGTNNDAAGFPYRAGAVDAIGEVAWYAYCELDVNVEAQAASIASNKPTKNIINFDDEWLYFHSVSSSSGSGMWFEHYDDAQWESGKGPFAVATNAEFQQNNYWSNPDSMMFANTNAIRGISMVEDKVALMPTDVLYLRKTLSIDEETAVAACTTEYRLRLLVIGASSIVSINGAHPSSTSFLVHSRVLLELSLHQLVR